MKKIIKLTESDLHEIVKKTIRKVIKENNNEPLDITNSFISAIFDAQYHWDTWDEGWHRDVDVYNEGGETFSFDLYVYRDITPGSPSHDYDVPDDPDEVSVELEIDNVKAYDSEGNEIIPITFDENEVLNALYDLF